MSNPPTPTDGYLKYDCQLIHEKMSILPELFEPMNYWRNILWDKGLIGAYPDGIGYGNISVRIPGTEQFYISGTATGSLSKLNTSHYALVEQCDPSRNSLRCRGQIRASAESMSHFAIYNSLPDAQAVVHIHNRPLWERYLDVLPTTPQGVEYGTPAMAAEITRILTLPDTLRKKIIIMGGHEEGIIAFGQTMEEAASLILALN